MTTGSPVLSQWSSTSPIAKTRKQQSRTGGDDISCQICFFEKFFLKKQQSCPVFAGQLHSNKRIEEELFNRETNLEIFLLNKGYALKECSEFALRDSRFGKARQTQKAVFQHTNKPFRKLSLSSQKTIFGNGYTLFCLLFCIIIGLNQTPFCANFPPILRKCKNTLPKTFKNL